MRSAIERRPLMLILVSLPSFLSRQAVTISSGSSSREAQNSLRNTTRDGSSLGSIPDWSRSPANQVLTELYSWSGLLIDAIVISKLPLFLIQKDQPSLRKPEHAGQRLDFLFSPRQRRRRLDHLGGLELLGHLG